MIRGILLTVKGSLALQKEAGGWRIPEVCPACLQKDVEWWLGVESSNPSRDLEMIEREIRAAYQP